MITAESIETIKARARLWLRSEKMMGLDSVAWRPQWSDAEAQSQNQPEIQAVSTRAAQFTTSAIGHTSVVADRPIAAPAQRAVATIGAAVATPARAVASATTMPTTTAGVSAPPSTTALRLAPEQEPIDLSPLPRERKLQLLVALDEKMVRSCTRCRLCQTRTKTVFGEGDADAPILFIGEGPGENEDLQGRPFVGRAGEKLNEMIGAMGLTREHVYIANVVKCRPPGNRAPAPDETEACTPYLVEQIKAIRPKVIVTLGLPAAKFMLNSNLSMTRLRGQWHDWRGVKLMPTFHPAYILRNYTVETRKAVWSDLQKVMQELGLKPTK